MMSIFCIFLYQSETALELTLSSQGDGYSTMEQKIFLLHPYKIRPGLPYEKGDDLYMAASRHGRLASHLSSNISSRLRLGVHLGHSSTKVACGTAATGVIFVSGRG